MIVWLSKLNPKGSKVCFKTTKKEQQEVLFEDYTTVLSLWGDINLNYPTKCTNHKNENPKSVFSTDDFQL